MIGCQPTGGNMEVAGVKCRGSCRKTWSEYVKDDIKLFGMQSEWLIFTIALFRNIILYLCR